MDAENYRYWISAELASSPLWPAHVDRRRAEALKPRRTASGYAIASYSGPGQMEVALEEARSLPRSERPYAWSEERVARGPGAPAPNEPLEHLRRYHHGLHQDEKSWIGASAATELHTLYCGPTGYIPNLPSALALFPAPQGGQASLAAAKITGASWGASTARRQAFYRCSPRYETRERFTALLHPRGPKA